MAIFDYKGLKIDTDTLTVNDMPNEVMSEIFTLCGAETAVSLLINMRGCIIQVPVKGMLGIEAKIIKSKYDGTTTSIREIIREYGISESYIRNILSNNKLKLPVKGQMQLELNYQKEEN